MQNDNNNFINIIGSNYNSIPPHTQDNKHYDSLDLTSQNNTIGINASVYSLITGLYGIKKPVLFAPHSLIYSQVAIEEYNNDAWILTGDFNDDDDMTDDEILLNITQVTSLWDEISGILNISMLEEEEQDDHFKLYLECVSNNVQHVANSMIEYPNWSFDPMPKFLWIYLVMACHYEPRALKYLLNSPYFDEDLLSKPDKYGFSCVLVACKQTNVDIISQLNLNNNVSMDMLAHAYDFNGMCPIVYATLNTDIFKYICDNIPNIDDIIKKVYKNGSTLFLTACRYNEEAANYLLNSKYMDQDYFNKTSNGYTCLMMVILNDNSNNLLKTLLDSEYCSQELFDKTIPKYGNIGTLAGRYNSELLHLVLDSKYMNPSIFDAKIEHRNNIVTDILFECASQEENFKHIINSPHFNPELLKYTINGENILYELERVNMDGLRRVLELPSCTMDIIVGDLSLGTNSSFISYISTKKPELLISMIKSGKLSNDILNYVTEFGRNLAMSLIKTGDTHTVSELIELLDESLLKHKDNYGFNTLVYMCKYRPEHALLILDNPYITDLISDIFMNNSPMIHAICCVTYNKDLITKLCNYCTEELFEIVNDRGNNLLLEVSEYNQTNIKFILESKYCTKKVVNQINKYGESCLTYAINKTLIPLNLYIIDYISKHKFCTPELLNYKNSNGETPFLVACKNGYNVTKVIMDSPYFNTNSLYCTDNHGMNCFTYACTNKDFELFKTICDHESEELKEMFELVDENDKLYISNLLGGNTLANEYILNHKYFNKNLLQICLKSWVNDATLINPVLMKYILESEYCDKETLLYQAEESRLNILITQLYNENILSVREILQSKHCSSELLEQVDLEKNSCLCYIGDNSLELYDDILNSEHFTSKILHNVGNNGCTILHSLISYDINSDGPKEFKYRNELEKVVKSEFCTESLLTKTSYSESGGLNVIASMYTYGIHDIILNLPYITKDGLLCVNNLGRTCLHDLVCTFMNDINNTCKDHFKEILDSGKCSSELFEIQDQNGDTFLLLGSSLINIVLESEFCTTKLLASYNVKGINIFSVLCSQCSDNIITLINHPKTTSDIFMIPYTFNNTPLNYTLLLDDTTFKTIINLDICTDECINFTNHHGNNLLIFCIANKYYSKLEIFLQSGHDLSPSFHTNNKKILKMAIMNDYNIFKILMESKYVTKDILLKSDKYGHNIITYAFGLNLDVVKYIVESDYWTDDIMYQTDIDGDFLLIHAFNRPEIVKYILESDKCPDKMILMENKLGMTCATAFAKQNLESFNILLASDKLLKKLSCTEQSSCDIPLSELLCKQDIYGQTPLHILSSKGLDYDNSNMNAIKELIKSPYFDEELLRTQDKNGLNSVMTALKNNNSHIAKLILDTDKVTEELLKQQDVHGNTILMYVSKYSIDCLKLMIDQDYYTKETLEIRNNDNETAIMYACKYNAEAVKLLLNLDECTNELLFSGHTDYGSVLTIAAKHNQPLAIKYILGWDDLSWQILYTLDNGENFIQIACMNSSDTIKWALETDYDFTEQLNPNIANPVILIAAKYQPNAVKYILESDYGSQQMITVRKNGRNCIDEAYDNQPKSLLHIVQSTHITEDILNEEDEIGYKLISKIRRNYPNVDAFTDIKNINLTEYDNELINNDDDPSACHICYTYKTKVIFSPCLHVACVGCAFKLRKCHQCRETINEKKPLYM